MMLGHALMAVVLAGVSAERAVLVIQAPDSPVRLERATLLTPETGPPVLLYAAANTGTDPLDQFTVIAFIFDAQGMLKARQLAPGRRTLETRETKYSTMVLDGSPILPTDVIVVGVNQAQRV